MPPIDSSQDTSTPSATPALRPQPKWWLFFLVGVALTVIGTGFVWAYYPGLLQPTDIETSQEPAEDVGGWLPASALVSEGVGYTASEDGYILYFNEQTTYRYLNYFEIWAFKGGVSLPTYGIDKRDKSKSYLYFVSDEGISAGGREVDADSFRVLSTAVEDTSCGYLCRYDAYSKDSKYLKGALYPPFPNNAHADTFSVIYGPDGSFSGFARDKDNLYASFDVPKFSSIEEMFGERFSVDPSSFQVLGGGYYKDIKSVYYDAGVDFISVSGAQAETFRYDLGAAKDANNVYYYGRIIQEADPNTFVVVYPHEYFKDKSHVYDTNIHGSIDILINADPATFSYDFRTDIARDKNYVWVGSAGGKAASRVFGADPETFVALNPEYYKDVRSIYHGYSNVTPVEADILSFRVYQTKTTNGRYPISYAVDNNSVYYEGKKVVGADLVTFEPLKIDNPLSCGEGCEYDSQDKSRKYLRGEAVD